MYLFNIIVCNYIYMYTYIYIYTYNIYVYIYIYCIYLYFPICLLYHHFCWLSHRSSWFSHHRDVNSRTERISLSSNVFPRTCHVTMVSPAIQRHENKTWWPPLGDSWTQWRAFSNREGHQDLGRERERVNTYTHIV